MTEKEITGTLEQWRYEPHYNVFWGYIYYDVKGRFWDGAHIHTSYIPSLSETRKFEGKTGDLIFTANSIYRLGKPFKQ
jgi:hypothetical protein